MKKTGTIRREKMSFPAFLWQGLLLAMLILITGCIVPLGPDLTKVEKNLHLKIPADFTIVDYYEDGMGFDYIMRVELEFGEKAFQELLGQVQDSPDWRIVSTGYELGPDLNEIDARNAKSHLEGKVKIEERRLFYEYADL